MTDTEKVENVEGCTCNDEFATVVCPVHHEAKSKVEEEILIVTDDQLISNEMGVYRGYIFMCPGCGEPGIMANDALGKSCTKCKRDVLIRSKIVTETIRKIEKQNV